MVNKYWNMIEMIKVIKMVTIWKDENEVACNDEVIFRRSKRIDPIDTIESDRKRCLEVNMS